MRIANERWIFVNMAKISIITRTRSRERLLHRCMEMIARQCYKDFVWIIVNDGGDARAVDAIVAEALSRKVTTVAVHNKESLGRAAAMNIGLRAATSEYIAICDDDDTWEPQFLSETSDFLDRQSRYQGVVTRATWIDEEILGDTIREISRRPINPKLRVIYLIDVARENIIYTMSFVYRRVIHDVVGYYNEDLEVLEDWEFNLRFLEHFDIGVLPKFLSNYHVRPNATGHLSNSVRTVEAEIGLHLRYDALVRNALLRRDLREGKLGVGVLMGLGRHHLQLTQSIDRVEDVVNKANRALDRLGLKRILKFFSR